MDPTDRSPRPSERTSGAAGPGTLEPAFGSWGHDPHRHDFHQFLYAAVGHAIVWAEEQPFRLSSGVGLWIPVGTWHSARFDSDCLIESIAFDPDEMVLPFTRCTEIGVPAGRRRVILAHLREDGEPTRELFEALVDDARPLPLPDPRTAVPLAVAAGLKAAPQDPRTATEWALSLYTSPTTLRRAFVAETGLTFSEWRTRLRLNASIDLLAQGLMVAAVAQRVGFTSTNGFILAFRRYFDQTPKAYAIASLCA